MRSSVRLRALLLAIPLLSWTNPAPAATTFTVTDCGDTTPGGDPGQLRKLINEASSGDTILIPAGCTITLDGAAGEELNQEGDLDINKSLAILGAGAALSAVDGNAVDRVFHVKPVGAQNVVIAGLTIRNGFTATGAGGGIFNLGELILHDVHVTGNVADSGGAGGGIWNAGTLIMAFSAVTGNREGGIVNSGTLAINNSTIAGNSNISPGAGLITDLEGSTAALTNVTISGNITPSLGGGILAAGDSVMLTNVTITGNSAGLGGGGIHNSGFTASMTLRNTMVSHNSTGGDCNGGLVSAGHNIDSDDTCGLTAPGDQPNTDPMLGPLARLGGFNDTHALLPGSPAIDAGDPSTCAATDQRAVVRPLDGDGDGSAVCDIGAVEQFSFGGTLAIALNQPSYVSGDTLALDVTVSSPGPAVPVDVYFGFVLPPAAGPGLGCPAGDAIAFMTPGFGVAIHCLAEPPSAFPRLAEAILLPPALPPTFLAGFFTAVVPAIPAGGYTAFLGLTVPGALVDNTLDPGELLAADTRTFTAP